MADETTQAVSVEVDGRVATLAFANPAQKGAFTPTVLEALRTELLNLARVRDSVTVVVLQGTNGVFSSGYAIDRLPDPESLAEVDEIEELCAAIEACRLVVIAMLESFAVGAALDVAAACDFRFAGQSCRLGITPAKLGLVYTVNGTARIHRLVGADGARMLFYTGDLISASDAARLGLVTRVHPDAELEQATYGFAHQLAARAPLSLAGAKEVIRRIEQETAVDEASALQRLHALRVTALASADAAEARAAFQERRPARFAGVDRQ